MGITEAAGRHLQATARQAATAGGGTLEAATQAAPAATGTAMGHATPHAGIAAALHLPAPVRDAATQAGIQRSDVWLLHRSTTTRPLPLFDEDLRSLGATPRYVDLDQLQVDPSGIRHAGQELPIPDAVISRGVRDHEMPVLQQLEDAGAHLVNRPEPMLVARHKALMPEMFARGGVPHPDTIVVRSPDDLHHAARELGLPLVVKDDRGFGGQSVWLARSSADLDALAGEHLLDTSPPRLLIGQRFHAEAGARDLRVSVVRDIDGTPQVAAVMERVGAAGDFRANGPNGNTVRWLDPRVPSESLGREELEVALRATDAAGLDVAGVDVMRTDAGPMVIEINSTPGLVQTDVAGLPRMFQESPRIAAYAVHGARP